MRSLTVPVSFSNLDLPCVAELVSFAGGVSDFFGSVWLDDAGADVGVFGCCDRQLRDSKVATTQAEKMRTRKISNKNSSLYAPQRPLTLFNSFYQPCCLGNACFTFL